MSDMVDLQKIWKSAVPREGISHSFLMDAILSLSAAHLASLHHSEHKTYRKRALVLRNQALNSALPYLSTISPDNCDALFAFAGIVALSVFALPMTSSKVNSVCSCSPIDDILDFFPLIRGIGSLVRNGSTLSWINRGDLQPLIEPHGRWPIAGHPEIVSLPKDLQAKLDNLQVLNEQTSCTDNERRYYTSAIQSLKNAFGKLISIPDGRSSLFVWGGVVPDDFLLALRARRPLALTVLAHYGVLVHQANHWWWCGDRGAQLVRAIHGELPKHWQAAVRWPMEVIQNL